MQLSVFILLTAGSLVVCKKPYEPPIIKSETNFLVVDGTINCSSNSVSTITLSRTRALSDSVLFSPVLNADVSIEQEPGTSYRLGEQSNGVYATLPLNLTPDKRYRLRIKTLDNREYLSEYTAGKTSPPIDSLGWKQDGAVTVSVYTHDPQNNTRYYSWDYVETWNYSSIYSGAYGVKNGLIFVKDSTTQTDSCWRTGNSTNIILSSSVALSEDVISNFPVAVVPQNDERISKSYSILVKQYALSEAAFRYLQLIQKNTQQLGTLFDAQPSQLKGNIESVSDPGEPVIGYISASTASEKRIFIRNSQLHDWHYDLNLEFCGNLITIGQNPVNYLIWDYPDNSFYPYYFITGGLVIAKKACLECTEQGGVNVKPPFWP